MITGPAVYVSQSTQFGQDMHLGGRECVGNSYVLNVHVSQTWHVSTYVPYVIQYELVVLTFLVSRRVFVFCLAAGHYGASNGATVWILGSKESILYSNTNEESQFWFGS